VISFQRFHLFGRLHVGRAFTPPNVPFVTHDFLVNLTVCFPPFRLMVGVCFVCHTSCLPRLTLPFVVWFTFAFTVAFRPGLHDGTFTPVTDFHVCAFVCVRLRSRRFRVLTRVSTVWLRVISLRFSVVILFVRLLVDPRFVTFALACTFALFVHVVTFSRLLRFAFVYLLLRCRVCPVSHSVYRFHLLLVCYTFPRVITRICVDCLFSFTCFVCCLRLLLLFAFSPHFPMFTVCPCLR